MRLEEKATAIFTELAATAGLVDPASRFNRLRELGPVAESAFGILVTGHAEAIEVLRHPHMNTSPSLAFGAITNVDWKTNPLLSLFGQSLFFDHGETHAGVRRVVTARFTPPALAKLQPMIADIVSAHIDIVRTTFERGGEVDLVTEFARPIPIAVACTMLGLPLDDAPRLTELLLKAQIGGAQLTPSDEELAELAEVGIEFTEYLDHHLHHASPDTLLGEIASAQLTPEQARGLAFILLAAGFETTSNLIANCVNLVLRHDTLETLNPLDLQVVRALIDETLRYDAPVQMSVRANDGEGPVTIGESVIAAQRSVIVMLSAAGRDPKVYEAPNEFQPARFLTDGASLTAAPPLSFGSGIHHCLGHHLARQQAEIALAALLPLLKDVAIADRDPDWRQLLQVRSLVSLRVRTKEESSVRVPSKGKRLQRKRRRQSQMMVARVGLSKLGHRIGRVVTPKANRADSDAAASAKQAQRAAETFGEMRGVMLKYGQLFSYTAPGLSEGAAAALASLQDNVEPMKPGEAERVIEAELGGTVGKLFASFDPLPIAAASIGQVHRATLHDGRAVAVKVQYEGIADAVNADLQELERTQKLLSRFVMRNLDAKALSAELNARLSEELDYRIEAANQREFAKRYANHPFIRIPSVIDDRSAQRVLTTEWIDGMRWNDFAASASVTQKQRDNVGEMLARFIVAGLRRYGTFQADAHPGNFIVDPNGTWLAVLDFGLVKRFSNEGAKAAAVFDDAVYKMSELTPLEAAEAIGYFPEAHTITTQRFNDYLQPVHDMWGASGTITHAMYEKAIRTNYDPRAGFGDIVRQANAPAEAILQDRLAYGMLALLAGLQATGDWPGIRRQYSHGEPPTTVLGELEHEWFTGRRR